MKTAERQFTTLSGVPVEPVYGPAHTAGVETGAPGEFPYVNELNTGVVFPEPTRVSMRAGPSQMSS
jgi:hypothetical protein